MVGERHTNIAISNWLLQWISSDIKKTKETDCDNSLALHSVIVEYCIMNKCLSRYRTDGVA